MKNKIGLVLFLFLSSFYFYSCDEDKTIEEHDYLTLSEVSIKQEVNGESEVCKLESKEDVVNYATRLTFADKSIEWNNLTFEQQLDPVLVVDEAKVAVTGADGKTVNTIDVSVESNNVIINFQKVDKQYAYVSGKTFTITIPANLKTDISKEELEKIATDGIKTEGKFYADNQSNSVKSNTVIIKIDAEEPIVPDPTYDIKGDPRNNEYKHKLNVVYFVASDITPNDRYQERISTILLKHQLFVCKWMKYWGYEEKSFGLPLAENGMVDIVTVNGKLKKSEYPYSGGNSKMKAEIEAYYKENNLTFLSAHTLVISATNGNIDDTPFYGSGKWCYALDYPGMSYDLYNIDPLTHEAMSPTPLETALIGGLLHEMSHGLNQPHVGPTYSQKNDPMFGMTLMGSGNQTYGKKPTFMHPSSAAIMNNCQISSFEEKEFYGTSKTTLTLANPIINGSKCLVKGTFTSTHKVTDVIVRFYDSKEGLQVGNQGYTSIAFVAKPSGDNFEITIPIEELRVQSFDYKIGITVLLENGQTYKMSQPYVYTLVKEGSEYTLESDYILNDGSWEVTVSHDLPEDKDFVNVPGSLVDGDVLTSLSMVKPGKNYGGIKVPSEDELYAIIDFKKQKEFNRIELTNRNFQLYLNPKVLSFYGSNDGVNYTEIKVGFEMPEKVFNNLSLDSPVKYQYLKITYDDWDKSMGSTIQIAELVLKNVK